jgi:hypothetical protein
MPHSCKGSDTPHNSKYHVTVHPYIISHVPVRRVEITPQRLCSCSSDTLQLNSNTNANTLLCDCTWPTWFVHERQLWTLPPHLRIKLYIHKIHIDTIGGLILARYMTSSNAARGKTCLQQHKRLAAASKRVFQPPNLQRKVLAGVLIAWAKPNTQPNSDSSNLSLCSVQSPVSPPQFQHEQSRHCSTCNQRHGIESRRRHFALSNDRCC